MMNDDSLLKMPDEKFLETILARLRPLEPSLESRLKNRLAIANELHHQCGQVAATNLRWWRRSILIPIPIAATAACLLIVAMLWSFIRPANFPPQTVVKTESAKPANFQAAEPAIAYFETGTYLCGVGRLKSDRGFIIQEHKQ
jgi:hypothetical protein